MTSCRRLGTRCLKGEPRYAVVRGTVDRMAIAERECSTYEIATRDEICAELDRLARERLDMSGEDFLRRLSAGELDEYSPSVSRIAVLARIIAD